ncbi:hypothetical protein A2U01_0022815, partial [Trifolium medium]|nr:hypothetical protein [Trifolium medium]
MIVQAQMNDPDLQRRV